jgi:hypothetical protein
LAAGFWHVRVSTDMQKIKKPLKHAHSLNLRISKMDKVELSLGS